MSHRTACSSSKWRRCTPCSCRDSRYIARSRCTLGRSFVPASRRSPRTASTTDWSHTRSCSGKSARTWLAACSGSDSTLCSCHASRRSRCSSCMGHCTAYPSFRSLDASNVRHRARTRGRARESQRGTFVDVERMACTAGLVDAGTRTSAIQTTRFMFMDRCAHKHTPLHQARDDLNNRNSRSIPESTPPQNEPHLGTGFEQTRLSLHCHDGAIGARTS